MKRASPQNWPTYVIWQSPSRVDGHFLLGGVPALLEQLLQRVFPPLLFHQWVYQEILQGLAVRAKMLEKYFKDRIIPVDVCLAPQVYQLGKALYPASGPGIDFTRDLGQWLTEQIMTSPFVLQRSGEFNLVVRCITAEKGEHPPPEAWRPMRGWRRVVRLAETQLIDTQWAAEHPFWLLFPRGADYAANVLVEVQNLLENEREIPRFNLRLEREEISLPFQKVNRGVYPLVDTQQHAALKPVLFPRDGLAMLYLRHCGQHETWIYGRRIRGGTNLGGWYMVPRDGWVPIESGNIILLGRMVKAEGYPRVVPGSLVLKLRYMP